MFSYFFPERPSRQAAPLELHDGPLGAERFRRGAAGGPRVRGGGAVPHEGYRFPRLAGKVRVGAGLDPASSIRLEPAHGIPLRMVSRIHKMLCRSSEFWRVPWPDVDLDKATYAPGPRRASNDLFSLRPCSRTAGGNARSVGGVIVRRSIRSVWALWLRRRRVFGGDVPRLLEQGAVRRYGGHPLETPGPPRYSPGRGVGVATASTSCG